MLFEFELYCFWLFLLCSDDTLSVSSLGSTDRELTVESVMSRGTSDGFPGVESFDVDTSPPSTESTEYGGGGYVYIFIYVYVW